MMIDNFHTFSYNGRRLSEFGAVMAQRPTIVTAIRDFNFSEIPYHSGDVISDNGRYKNIKLKIKIRAFKKFCKMDFQTWCYTITEWLNTAKDYVIYRDSYNPGYFRYGIVTDISEFQAVNKRIYESEVEITCKPFLYRDSGLKPISFTMTGNEIEYTLTNPESWESEPVITLEGTGNFQIVVGNALMAVDVTQKMTIDKPNENVFDKDDNPCNDKVTSIRLPNLTAGQNTIHITRVSGSGDLDVTIVPNWRRL